MTTTTITCPHCGKDIGLKTVPPVQKKPAKAHVSATKKKPKSKKTPKKTGGKK